MCSIPHIVPVHLASTQVESGTEFLMIFASPEHRYLPFVQNVTLGNFIAMCMSGKMTLLSNNKKHNLTFVVLDGGSRMVGIAEVGGNNRTNTQRS